MEAQIFLHTYLLGIGEDLEGDRAEIDLINSLRKYLRAESERLAPKAFHELVSKDSVGETGEVLDVWGGSELSPGGYIIGHPSLEEDRIQLGPGGVYGCCVGRGAAADDAEACF